MRHAPFPAPPGMHVVDASLENRMRPRQKSPGSESRAWHFSKTKMCKFEIIGMCAKGSLCPFAHAKREMRPLPDLTRTKLCTTLIETGACHNANCTYAHNRDELRTTSTFHKTKFCRFFL